MNRKICGIIALAFCFVILSVVVLNARTESFFPSQSYDFIIVSSGTGYVAQNGQTGATLSNPNFPSLYATVQSSLSHGGSILLKGTFTGSITVAHNILLCGSVVPGMEWSRSQNDGTIIHGDVTVGSEGVTLENLWIDGTLFLRSGSSSGPRGAQFCLFKRLTVNPLYKGQIALDIEDLATNENFNVYSNAFYDCYFRAGGWGKVAEAVAKFQVTCLTNHIYFTNTMFISGESPSILEILGKGTLGDTVFTNCFLYPVKSYGKQNIVWIGINGVVADLKFNDCVWENLYGDVTTYFNYASPSNYRAFITLNGGTVSGSSSVTLISDSNTVPKPSNHQLNIVNVGFGENVRTVNFNEKTLDFPVTFSLNQFGNPNIIFTNTNPAFSPATFK